MITADLPEPLQDQLERGSCPYPLQGSDVCCLVRKYIGDSNLSQRPLLVMTEEQARNIPNIPSEKHPRRVVKRKLEEEWLKLATSVTQFYGDSYKPAAEYLTKLVRGDFHEHTPLADIPWLRQNGVRFAGEPVFNLHKCVLDTLAPAAPLRAIWSRRQA